MNATLELGEAFAPLPQQAPAKPAPSAPRRRKAAVVNEAAEQTADLFG